MKIGVALSGCDMGGVSAFAVLRELAAQGLCIDMVSACCVPAVTALLYTHGRGGEVTEKLAGDFLSDTRESDLDTAVLNISEKFRMDADGVHIPLAINAVNVSDGDIVTFTNDYAFRTKKLRTLEYTGPYDALSATISLMDGLGSYHYKEYHLCDFCCWYGCPVYPLRMAGLNKIISVAFVPKFPKTPYEVLVRQMIAASANTADVHIAVEFPGRDGTLGEYIQTATAELKKHIKQIMFKTLF